LRGAPLLFVFYETTGLARQRQLLEQILGLKVIENQFHPPHHSHGLVKYDAGGVILALNLSGPGKLSEDGSDGLAATLSTPSPDTTAVRLLAHGCMARAGGVLTDPDGHHYVIRAAPSANRPGVFVPELRLVVGDLAASLAFYGETLGLELRGRTDGELRFVTGAIDLVLQRGRAAPDGRPARHNGYLLVFHTGDIQRAFEDLLRRGLRFKQPRVGFSEIGGTARFTDPSGHTYCLYEPSAVSLSWGSGPKVREIVGGRIGVDSVAPVL
jgi:catechol 2,3-dioxygenase-like lactoylglutathione lyase family enzyme